MVKPSDLKKAINEEADRKSKECAAANSLPANPDQPVEKPMPMFTSLGEMVNFMALHTTMHAGQITIIRRSLGRPPVI